MSKENPDKYKLHYPCYLPNHRQLWVVQKGDVMSSDDTDYLVKQVIKPLIAGMKPQLVIEPINVLQEHGTSDNST